MVKALRLQDPELFKTSQALCDALERLEVTSTTYQGHPALRKDWDDGDGWKHSDGYYASTETPAVFVYGRQMKDNLGKIVKAREGVSGDIESEWVAQAEAEDIRERTKWRDLLECVKNDSGDSAGDLEAAPEGGSKTHPAVKLLNGRLEEMTTRLYEVEQLNEWLKERNGRLHDYLVARIW